MTTRTIRLTDAGRAAMADGTNRQLNAIQVRSMKIGDGHGPGGAGDDARTTLRSEQASGALTGTTPVSGRLAVRANFLPGADFVVSEAGLVARIGDTGAEFLFAYWTVATDTNAVAHASTGTTLILAVVIDVTSSPAEVNVTISPSIVFGPVAFTALQGVPNVIGPGKYLRGDNTGTALEFDDSLPVVATEADLPTPIAAVVSAWVVTNYSSTGKPALAVHDGGAWRYFRDQSWVSEEIAALVGSTPSTLDTLAELGDALGDDPNFAATVATALGERATTTALAALAARVTAAETALEAPVVESKIIFFDDSSAGLALTSADTGTLVQLTEAMTGWRFLVMHCTFQPAGGTDWTSPLTPPPLAVLDIPAVRLPQGPVVKFSRELDSGIEEVIENMWTPSATTLRVQLKQSSVLRLRAIVAWGAVS